MAPTAEPLLNTPEASARSRSGNHSATTFTPAGQLPADLVEKVSAGYVMNTLDLTSRVRVVAGVRFEGTNLDTLSFDSQTNSLSDKASGSYLKILPSASLR